MAILIGLIDYGMGNLHSVQQSFGRLDQSLKLVKTPTDLNKCDALILPGVGAFDPAMENLMRTDLVPYIQSWVKKDRPFLGICLGLQLLYESSDEGHLAGLGLLEGHIKRLPDNQGERIPHMGWALLNKRNNCPLMEGQAEQNWLYFVHSYSAIPKAKSDVAATTKFGNIDVTAIVWKGRLGACQFHPEKSARTGQRMLMRWMNWLKNGAQPFL